MKNLGIISIMVTEMILIAPFFVLGFIYSLIQLGFKAGMESADRFHVLMKKNLS